MADSLKVGMSPHDPHESCRQKVAELQADSQRRIRRCCAAIALADELAGMVLYAEDRRELANRGRSDDEPLNLPPEREDWEAVVALARRIKQSREVEK